MRGEKNVIYENALGQRLVFDNKLLFIESLDMTGNSGIHAVENLAFADGQTSVYHQLAAKTIPCSFALKNINLDTYTKLYLESIFNPKLSGTLTVITKKDIYRIECRPQNVPSFKRDGRRVYRFDVDFVADFPYWQKGAEIPLTLSAYETFVYSNNPIDLTMKIVFPAGEATPFGVNGKGFTLKSYDFQITVNTQNFRVTNASGQNCNQYIDAAASLDNVYFRFGKNRIFCPVYSNVQIFYYDLSLGEI